MEALYHRKYPSGGRSLKAKLNNYMSMSSKQYHAKKRDWKAKAVLLLLIVALFLANKLTNRASVLSLEELQKRGRIGRTVETLDLDENEKIELLQQIKANERKLENEDLMKQFNEKGFFVIKNFYPTSICDKLATRFKDIPLLWHEDLIRVSANTEEETKLLSTILDKMDRDSKVDVNFLMRYAAVFQVNERLSEVNEKPILRYPWHQDEVSFLGYENHYDFVNVWIPVLKDDANHANLDMIPFNKYPYDKYRAYNEGGFFYFRMDNKTYAYDDLKVKLNVYDFDINDFKETILLEKGDALVWRADLIHQTQDSRTNRIAIKYQFVNRKTRFHYSNLFKYWSWINYDIILFEKWKIKLVSLLYYRNEDSISIEDAIDIRGDDVPTSTFLYYKVKLYRTISWYYNLAHNELRPYRVYHGA